MKFKEQKEKGITLIALIITIIILIILAAVSLRAVFFDGMIEVATDGVGNYATEQKKEENFFNDVDHYIKVATNKKPEFDYVEVKSMTPTSATIKTRAIDGDGENLTYILYMGTSADNLEEKAKKENIEQGTEVELLGEGINTGNLVYYRVDVKDKYATVQSQVSTLQNKKPEIEKAEITDITRVTAKAVIKGKDEDVGDKLTYKVYYGTDKDTLETTGKVVEKGDIVSGTEETLEIKDLTPGTKYYYKIAITDGMQTAHQEGEFTTIPNNAPIISDVSIAEVKSRTFTVKFKASDADGDNLTYKLTWGKTDDAQTGNNTKVTKKEDGYIYVDATGLTKITDYRYKVYAYDGVEADRPGESPFLKIKTLCDGKGFACDGPQECAYCDVNGNCLHKGLTNSELINVTSKNHTASYKGKVFPVNYISHYTCSNCNRHVYAYHKSAGGLFLGDYSSYYSVGMFTFDLYEWDRRHKHPVLGYGMDQDGAHY